MNAHAQQQKAVFFVRMLVIEELNREVIVKNGFCCGGGIGITKAFQGITRRGPAMLITATAIEYQLVLATRNMRNFMGCGVQVVTPFDGV